MVFSGWSRQGDFAAISSLFKNPRRQETRTSHRRLTSKKNCFYVNLCLRRYNLRHNFHLSYLLASTRPWGPSEMFLAARSGSCLKLWPVFSTKNKLLSSNDVALEKVWVINKMRIVLEYTVLNGSNSYISVLDWNLEEVHHGAEYRQRDIFK